MKRENPAARHWLCKSSGIYFIFHCINTLKLFWIVFCVNNCSFSTREVPILKVKVEKDKKLFNNYKINVKIIIYLRLQLKRMFFKNFKFVAFLPVC